MVTFFSFSRGWLDCVVGLGRGLKKVDTWLGMGLVMLWSVWCTGRGWELVWAFFFFFFFGLGSWIEI